MAKGAILSFSLHHHHHHFPIYQHLIYSGMVIALLLMVTGGVSSTSTTDYTAPSNRAKFDRCANFTHACLSGERGDSSTFNSSLRYCCCSHEWSTCESQLKCHGKKEHMRGSQESCDYINSLALKMNRRTACPGGNFSVCLVSGAPPPPVTMSGTMVLSAAVILMIFMQFH